MNGKVLALIGIVLAVFIGIGVMMNVTLDNKEVRLSNLAAAQTDVLEANYDKMWKSIKQIASVPDQAASKFKEMYTPLIEGRYGSEKGGALMKWVQESNPAFDWSLYGKVQTAIEANRTDFFNEQKKLVSIANQHKNLIETWPGTWFIDVEVIEVVVVSSTRSKKVMGSGIDDDVELFK